MSFATLKHHYVDRLEAAQAAHARGRRVVGLVGNTIPRELVLACGFFPVLVTARLGHPTPTADLYMEDFVAPETRALFELAMSGELAFLDLLVLSRPYAHLYYYLKEVYRLGRAPRLPPLHMLDLMQSQREAVRAYNEGELNRLIQRLEHLAGGPLTDSNLLASIATTNRARAGQRELQDHRWQRMLSGTHALEAIGAGYFLAPETYAEALAEYLSILAPDPALAHRPRLLVVSSEPLSHVNLHTALESAHAVVVGEADWWGSQAPGADVAVTGPPRQAILDKYWHATASSQVTPAEAREAWFAAHAVRDDVDGVVFYVPSSDRQLGWDYPRLKAWLETHHKPSIRLRIDATDSNAVASVQSELREWLEALQPGGVRT